MMAFTAPLLAAVDASSATPTQTQTPPQVQTEAELSQPQQQPPQPQQPHTMPGGQYNQKDSGGQPRRPSPEGEANDGQVQQYGGRFMFGQPPLQGQMMPLNKGMMNPNNQDNQNQFRQTDNGEEQNQKQQQDMQQKFDEQQQKMDQQRQVMMANQAKNMAKNLDRQLKTLKSKVASLTKRGLYLSVECQQVISAMGDLSAKLKVATDSDEIDSLIQDQQDTMDTVGNCMMQSQKILNIPTITKMVKIVFTRLKNNEIDATDLQDEYNTDILPLINNVKSGKATDDDIYNLFSSLDDFRSNVESVFSDNNLELPNMNINQPPQQPPPSQQGGPGQGSGQNPPKPSLPPPNQQ